VLSEPLSSNDQRVAILSKVGLADHLEIAPIGQGAKEMRAIKRKGHRVGSCLLSLLLAGQLTKQKAQAQLGVIHRKDVLNRAFSQLLREFEHIGVDLAERCHLLF
jgi:hypothetical protein